ncbi:hypothetical protein [Vreelandella sulfidaeris]
MSTLVFRGDYPTSDPFVLMIAGVVMAIILLGEWMFLAKRGTSDDSEHSHHAH